MNRFLCGLFTLHAGATTERDGGLGRPIYWRVWRCGRCGQRGRSEEPPVSPVRPWISLPDVPSASDYRYTGEPVGVPNA